MFDGGLPTAIMVDEGGMENLTIVLSGNLCGEVEVYFHVVPDNSSFTATPGIKYSFMLIVRMYNLYMHELYFGQLNDGYMYDCICIATVTTTDVDYTIVTISPLILSTEVPNATITIDINDEDDLFEPAEFFEISLFFKEQIMIPRVTLNPSTASITIRGTRFKVQYI